MAASISQAFDDLSTSANETFEDQGRRFVGITLDSLGSIRIEAHNV